MQDLGLQMVNSTQLAHKDGLCSVCNLRLAVGCKAHQENSSKSQDVGNEGILLSSQDYKPLQFAGNNLQCLKCLTN